MSLHDAKGAAGRLRRERLRLQPAILNLEGRQLLATLNVTNTNASGAGSLAAAIQTADSDGTANTIDFTGTVWKSDPTIDVDSTLNLTDTTGEQTIVGPSKVVTLEANNIKDVLSVSASVHASISGLTLGGGTRDGFYTSYGSDTSVSNCTITNNKYGVVNYGTLTITKSTVSDNSAAKKGGGIVNWGTLSANDCTISGNSDPDEADIAAGVTNTDVGTASLMDCTISGNSAGISPGGIVQASGKSLTVTGGTISGNSGYIGGGVGIDGPGAVTITGTTFSGDSASLYWRRLRRH